MSRFCLILFVLSLTQSVPQSFASQTANQILGNLGRLDIAPLAIQATADGKNQSGCNVFHKFYDLNDNQFFGHSHKERVPNVYAPGATTALLSCIESAVNAARDAGHVGRRADGAQAVVIVDVPINPVTIPDDQIIAPNGDISQARQEMGDFMAIQFPVYINVDGSYSVGAMNESHGTSKHLDIHWDNARYTGYVGQDLSRQKAGH